MKLPNLLPGTTQELSGASLIVWVTGDQPPSSSRGRRIYSSQRLCESSFVHAVLRPE